MLFHQAWEGVGVVASARKLIGSTDPLNAEPGTIRGDLAVQTGRLGPSYYPDRLLYVLIFTKLGSNFFPGLSNFFHPTLNFLQECGSWQ